MRQKHAYFNSLTRLTVIIIALDAWTLGACLPFLSAVLGYLRNRDHKLTTALHTPIKVRSELQIEICFQLLSGNCVVTFFPRTASQFIFRFFCLGTGSLILIYITWQYAYIKYNVLLQRCYSFIYLCLKVASCCSGYSVEPFFELNKYGDDTYVSEL